MENGLEVESQGELHLPRLACCCSQAKAASPDICSNPNPICVVEDFEQIDTETQLHGLGDGEVFANGKVRVEEARPVNGGPAGAAQPDGRPRQRIDRDHGESSRIQVLIS